MTTHYVDKKHPLLGSYHEAAAWRDAADDWESNGDSNNRRLTGNMRATATRLEREI